MSTTVGEGKGDLRSELTRLQRGSFDGAYLFRLCCAQLTLCGIPPNRVAACLGASERSVRRWAAAAAAEGPDAVRTLARRGRPSLLDEHQLGELRETLEQRPCDIGFSERGWSAPVLKRLLEDRFGVALGTRQCQRLLRRFLGPEHSAVRGPKTAQDRVQDRARNR